MLEEVFSNFLGSARAKLIWFWEVLEDYRCGINLIHGFWSQVKLVLPFN